MIYEFAIKPVLKEWACRPFRLLFEELNKILWVAYGQGPQKQSVDEREYLGCGRDSHRDQKSGDCEEAGRAASLSNAIA